MYKGDIAARHANGKRILRNGQRTLFFVPITGGNCNKCNLPPEPTKTLFLCAR
jgi:hypothetical protein